jgi:hypothetical protein
MTHRQVRHLATELAGTFYEFQTSTKPELEREKRSQRFRAAFPNVKSYLKGHYHKPDGTVEYTKPAWVHFVVQARAMMTQMLMRNDINDHMKNEIYEALLEEGEKASRKSAKSIVQRMN